MRTYAILLGVFLAMPVWAAPAPATGSGDAKSVHCSGTTGEFYMNFPDIQFATDDNGMTTVQPGTVCVGYKNPGDASFTKYQDSYVGSIVNGPSNIMQTGNATTGFSAFVYTSPLAGTAWVQGSGDLGQYGANGNGSMTCQFYQSAWDVCP